MMMKKMCPVHKAAWCLLMIGGLNWLLVGLSGKDLFGWLNMGMDSWPARVVYVLVGLSALSMFMLKKCCMGKCMCGSGKMSEDCCMKDPGAHGMMADKAKAMEMMKPCGCGSGKPGWQCCSKGEADKMKGQMCFCGSGKKIEDCCMKSPETHKM